MNLFCVCVICINNVCVIIVCIMLCLCTDICTLQCCIHISTYTIHILYIIYIYSNACIGRLPGHDSTVVAIQFSPDDWFLASAGKDRSICIYTRTYPSPSSSTTAAGGCVASEQVASGVSTSGGYTLCTGVKNAHKRIIWDCWYVCICIHVYV